MKQFTLLFILTFFTLTFSQAQWISQNSNTEADLTSIHARFEDNAVVVGTFGTIIKTSNGGANWVTLNSGTTQNLRSVFFVNADTGWVVGTDDILITTNGGNTWAYQQSVITTMNDIDFFNENTGWVVGTVGRILYTSNGGVNWIQQTSGTTEHFSSVDFTDSAKGWTVGTNGSIYYTQNGGVNWIQQTSGTTQDLYSVDFINANTGWTAGYNGTIRKTTNSGNSWNTQDAGTTRDFNSVGFNVGLTGLKGWVLSADKLYTTDNGGITWTEQDTSPNAPGIGMSYFTLKKNDEKYSDLTPNGTKGFEDFSEAITAYIVGDSGTIKKTTNGGVFVNNNNTSIPDEYSLHQNYPNPFNPNTTITFDISNSGFISLIVYDVLGREVAILLNKRLTAGSYIGEWNAEGYNSGVYFYRLTAGDYMETRKMLLVK